ncbi:MAG: cytochrome c3 family protein, partial [Planctomycetota bacterium]
MSLRASRCPTTTTGHLGDGLYENGVVRDRHPRIGIFPVSNPLFDPKTAPPGAVKSVNRISGFKSGSRKDRISTHFSDVPRKGCMNCHLWNKGRAVRGRLGLDGDYRGEGCAACHIRYEDDGITRSADPTISRVEPGHPEKHVMVKVPKTQMCTRCHYGDASIGLNFRGLAQPVPGMPQSPDAAGFARKRLNGLFYIEDPAVNPPDIHHARGMQCADCHTAVDTMGDGHIYTRMEDAVETECSSCHGTPEAYATGRTDRGNEVRGLLKREDGYWLRSPSDSTMRRVKQARDVVDPTHRDFNRKAAMAMTSDHSRLECDACHTSWNP